MNPSVPEALRKDSSAGRACYHVLIVDDDDLIREGLVNYLTEYHVYGYELIVDAASSPADARQKLAARSSERPCDHPYDLVIADVNMPGEDGFSLLRHVHTAYPSVKTAMITAYKVEDYIRNAKENGVFNIISKTTPFDFAELSLVVDNLLNPSSAFGLDRYMEPGCPLSEVVIQSSDDIMLAFSALQELLETCDAPNPNDLLTAVIEAITNAVYHVAKLPDGSLKYEKGQVIPQLAENEVVHVYYGRDAKRLGISIVDQGGRITADEILYWLERNSSGAGLMDSHGRGMFLIHRLVDRVLINIAPGRRTEIILLNQPGATAGANKPIYINQL